MRLKLTIPDEWRVNTKKSFFREHWLQVKSTDGECVRTGKDRAQYSTPHRKPECVKWEGAAQGLFFRRAAEGLCVSVEAEKGGTDQRRPGMWPYAGKETPALHTEESGERQTQLKNRKKWKKHKRQSKSYYWLSSGRAGVYYICQGITHVCERVTPGYEPCTLRTWELGMCFAPSNLVQTPSGLKGPRYSPVFPRIIAMVFLNEDTCCFMLTDRILMSQYKDIGDESRGCSVGHYEQNI